MSIVSVGRSLLLGVALVAASAEARIRIPGWEASPIHLSQYLRADPNEVAARFSDCEERSIGCESLQSSTALILLAKTDLPAAVRAASKILANPDNAKSMISVYAAQVMAISGDSRLLLRMNNTGTLTEDAWALAKGGDYSQADAVVGSMSAHLGSEFCSVSVYADPFLDDASRVRDAVLKVLLTRLVGTDSYASQCAADVLIRAHYQLDAAAIGRVADVVLLLLRSSEISRQIRGAELAGVLLPRLSRSQELASALLRTVVNATSWPVWHATSTAAAANGLVGASLPTANESVSVNSKLVTLTVGDGILKPIPFLVQQEFVRAWPSFLPGLDDMQLAELIHALTRDDEGLTDRKRKLQYLLDDNRVKRSYITRLAAVTALDEEFREQTQDLSETLFQQSNALQRTTLATKFVNSIFAVRAKGDWEKALSSDNPWLRLAALCNAAQRCQREVPQMSGLAQTDSSIVAYNKLIETNLVGCRTLP